LWFLELKEKNPELPFGELSKLVGVKWKELTAEEKHVLISFFLLYDMIPFSIQKSKFKIQKFKIGI